MLASNFSFSNHNEKNNEFLPANTYKMRNTKHQKPKYNTYKHPQLNPKIT